MFVNFRVVQSNYWNKEEIEVEIENTEVYISAKNT